ncbi:hypothetical protein FDX11_16100 [Citrobacter sp. wls714]|nr:hypothetical protein FDX11_16100 [Citrobacter sp. wls714]
MSAPQSCYGGSISLRHTLIKELKILAKNKAFLEKNRQCLYTKSFKMRRGGKGRNPQEHR